MKRSIPLLLAIALMLSLCGCLSKADKEKYMAAVDAKIQENMEAYKSGEKFFSDLIDIDDVSYEIVEIQESLSASSDIIVTLRFEATTDEDLDYIEKSLACYDMEQLFYYPDGYEVDGHIISTLGTGKAEYKRGNASISHVSSWINGEEIHSMDPMPSSKKSDAIDSFGHDKYDAMAVAESVVKSNLKAPSTAKFCRTSEATISCSGDTWTIKGWVDAQNSFGATLRNDFTVKVTFSSKDRYSIDSCNIS